MHYELFPTTLAPEEVANISFPEAKTPPDEKLYPDVSDTCYNTIPPTLHVMMLHTGLS